MIEATTIETVVIEGLLIGGIYSLAAVGISLIFSITNILNLAHGNFIMLGGVLTFIFFNFFAKALSSLLALVISLFLVLALFALFGFFTEISLIRRLYVSKDMVGSAILTTIGLALVLQDVSSYIAINDPSNVSHTSNVSLTLPSLGSLFLGGYYFGFPKLVSLVTIVVATLVLYLFLKKTYLGIAMRSISQDREAAMISGVNLGIISILVFVLGSVFAGFAGYVLVIDQSVDPVLGIGFTIKLLTILVLGGVKTPLGPILGGLSLGVIESAVATFIGAYWVSAASLTILIVILLVRPSGLGGE